MTRFTLSYTCKDGTKQTLYNLFMSAVGEITQAQAGLGSHAFNIEAQERDYSQQEIDLLREK